MSVPEVPKVLEEASQTAPSAQPHISLVVPFFNVEDYLEDCLASIAAQTYPSWEAVCVNDGSTDGSRAIVERYAGNDERFRLSDKANGGLSSARNCGIHAACAPIVWFVDSDDVIEANACARLVEAFEQTNADVVTFGAHCFPEKEATDWLRTRLSPRDVVYDDFSPDLVFREMSLPYAWRTACRRSFLERSGVSFDEALRFGEDQVFHFALYPRATRTALISDKLYRYRLAREGSLMRRMEQDPAAQMAAHLEITRRVMDDWDGAGFLRRYPVQMLAWTVEFVLYGIICLEGETREMLLKALRAVWLNHFSRRELDAFASDKKFPLPDAPGVPLPDAHFPSPTLPTSPTSPTSHAASSSTADTSFLPSATAALVRAALAEPAAFEGFAGKRLRFAYYLEHFGLRALLARLFGRSGKATR